MIFGSARTGCTYKATRPCAARLPNKFLQPYKTRIYFWKRTFRVCNRQLDGMADDAIDMIGARRSFARTERTSERPCESVGHRPEMAGLRRCFPAEPGSQDT